MYINLINNRLNNYLNNEPNKILFDFFQNVTKTVFYLCLIVSAILKHGVSVYLDTLIMVTVATAVYLNHWVTFFTSLPVTVE